VIDALLQSLALKKVKRAGWLRNNLSDTESVADHSWGLAWLTMLLLPTDLQLERALSYAIIHDLAESITGDITPHDGISPADKHRMEHKAMGQLTEVLPHGANMLSTWKAYEAQHDPEALFVRQLDKLELAFQAVRYENEQDCDLSEFLDNVAPALTDATLKNLFEELLTRRTS
jgi:putative hydrolase of HD superfamily